QVKSVQDKISQRSVDVQNLLLGPQLSFILISGYDEAQLLEAKKFHGFLKAGGYRLSGVIVNRAFPEWKIAERTLSSTVVEDPELEQVRQLYEKMSQFFGD